MQAEIGKPLEHHPDEGTAEVSVQIVSSAAPRVEVSFKGLFFCEVSSCLPLSLPSCLHLLLALQKLVLMLARLASKTMGNLPDETFTPAHHGFGLQCYGMLPSNISNGSFSWRC